MTSTIDRVCVCSHPEGEHTLQGECMIHRRDHGIECGCERFSPLTQCDLCGSVVGTILKCSTHDLMTCSRCYFSAKC